MNTTTIVYVEDEEDDVFFMERAFRQLGLAHRLVILPDGQEAIDYGSGSGLYGNREKYPLPSLMLVDLNLPKKSGLEVLKWIRGHPPLRTLPVVMVTSSNQDADVDRAYQHGANAYLVKPSTPSELVIMVKAIHDFWLMQNRTK